MISSSVLMLTNYLKGIYNDYLLKKRGEIILKKSNIKGFRETITRLLERTTLSDEINFVEIIFDKNLDTLSIRFTPIEPDLSKVLKYQIVTPETKINTLSENLNITLFALGFLCAEMTEKTGIISIGNDAQKNIFIYYNSPVVPKTLDDGEFLSIFLKSAT